jgi:hypothetical protein
MTVSETNPYIWRLAPDEVLVLGVDESDSLPPTGTVSSPTVTLTDIGTGAAITLPSPLLSGSVISVEITGSDLALGHSYLLEVLFDGGPSAPQLSSRTIVVCTPGTRG